MRRAFRARARAGAGFSAEWAAMTLSTQACLDAAMDSMARDGAAVPVVVVRPGDRTERYIRTSIFSDSPSF